MALAPGTRIAGYVIDRVLGQGGMGTVYEATQLSLGRVVALKIIAPQLASDNEFRERFQREGRIQAALDHRSIVTVHEAGESDHGFFIAMRLVRGPTLKDLVMGGALDPPRTFKLLGAVADALDTANEAGLVHRDVKPQNILVDQRDHAFLADFGVTKSRSLGALTRTGHWVGTLEYVAPEQVLGQPISGASDRYSFGVVLHECLTGSVPFNGDTDAALLYAHAHAAPPPVTSVRPDLPAELDDVLARALAKDPNERHATAIDIVADAQRAYEDGIAGVASVVKRSPAPPTRPAPPPPEPEDPLATLPPTRPAPDRDSLPGTRQGSSVEFDEAPTAPPTPPTPPIELAKPVARDETEQHRRPDLPRTRIEPGAGDTTQPPMPAPPLDRSQLPRTRIEDPAPRVPRPPPGPLPPRTPPSPPPPPPPDRVRASRTLLVLAVPIIIALGVAGFLVGKGGGDDSAGGGDEPVVASTRVASGPYELRVPAAWREPSEATDIPGLDLEDRIERAPAAGGGSLIVGVATVQDSSLLPNELNERLGDVSPGGAVRLGNIDALRYDDLRVIQPGDPATLFAAPVTDGALTAACVGTDAAFRRMCAAAVATLRLTRGENFGLGADTRLEESLTDALETLTAARSQGVAALRSAERSAGQASAANMVADAYAASAQQVQAGSDNPATTVARASLAGQLHNAAQAWRSVARAARSRNRSGYQRGRSAVRTAESRLRDALAQVGESDG